VSKKYKAFFLPPPPPQWLVGGGGAGMGEQVETYRWKRVHADEGCTRGAWARECSPSPSLCPADGVTGCGAGGRGGGWNTGAEGRV